METNLSTRFSVYYKSAFTSPAEVFSRLLQDERKLTLAFMFMLVPVFLYTLMYVFLNIANGAPSTFTPWLNIPKDSYYFYNQFLLAPSMIFSWFTAASVVQLLSRAFGGQGSFEETLAMLGLSISVALWSTLVHDLTMSFLSAIHVIDARAHEIAMNTPTIWRSVLWICFLVYFIWFPALFSKSVQSVHKLKKGPALAIGISGFVVFQLIFVIFNR